MATNPGVASLKSDLIFMRKKLKETRVSLKDKSVVVPYDNGGGQKGIRANPAFSEYEKLLKSYTSTLSFVNEQNKNVQKSAPKKSNLTKIRMENGQLNRKAI